MSVGERAGSPVGKVQARLLSHPVIGMYRTYELERADSLALLQVLLPG